MADTDLPNGFGAPKPAPRPRPRPIASPFGMLPTDGLTPPQPGPPPGFNVQPEQPQTNPMASLLASFLPSRQDVAETLGGPVDMLGYLAHRVGLQVPGGEAPLGWTPSYQGQQPWIPSADVPLSSQNILGMMNNPRHGTRYFGRCGTLGFSRRRMMARTAAEQDLDVFLSMVNQNCAAKLAELDREAFVAKCLPPDDAVAKSIADRRQRLIDLPGAIKPGTRAELAAQWPADFPPLSAAFVARNDFALPLGLPLDHF